MALTNKTFADLITFTRSGTATRVNSAGLIEDVAADTPRFDHDPVTGALKGLLIEEARTNLLTDSADFTQSAWTKNNATVNPNQILSPDGTATAEKITDDASTGSKGVNAQQTVTVATTTAYTCSVYAKADQTDWLQIRTALFTTPGNESTWFDVANGTVGTVGAGHTSSIEDAGGGWYRCIITFTTDAADTTGDIRFQLASSNGAVNVTADGTNSIYIWGAQLEAGSFPTSYIRTTTTSVTRNDDNASITGTAFSDWFNASEGTIYVEASAFGTPSGSSTAVSINSAVSDRLSVRLLESGSALNGFSQDGGTATASISSDTFTLNTPFKAAFAYKANDFAFSANGGTVATDTSGTLPSPDQATLGREIGTVNTLNGHIKNIKFYPSRLTDAELQALTT